MAIDRLLHFMTQPPLGAYLHLLALGTLARLVAGL
jgi:hypothetical protein